MLESLCPGKADRVLLPMTILNKLKQIKHQCVIRGSCVGCIFRSGKHCEARELLKHLNGKPSDWDLEKINKILGDSNNVETI